MNFMRVFFESVWLVVKMWEKYISVDWCSYGFLYFGYALLMIIPGISVFVRRMHDIGKSGWWYFIALIPIIGGIWLLVLCLTEGTHGDNEYGPDPKA